MSLAKTQTDSALLRWGFHTGAALSRAATALARHHVGSRVVQLPAGQSGCGRGLEFAARSAADAQRAIANLDLDIQSESESFGRVPSLPENGQGAYDLTTAEGLVDFLYEADQARVQPELDRAAGTQIDPVSIQRHRLVSGCVSHCQYCPESQNDPTWLAPPQDDVPRWFTGGEIHRLEGHLKALPQGSILDIGAPGLDLARDLGLVPAVNFRLPSDPEPLLSHPRSWDQYPRSGPYIQNVVVEVPTVTWEHVAELLLAIAADDAIDGVRIRPFQPAAGTPLGLFAAGCTFSTLKTVVACRVLMPTVNLWLDDDIGATLKPDAIPLLQSHGANGWIHG